MSELVENRRQELISQIITEVQSIKGVEFLSFFLELTKSFKRKWGV